MAPKSKFTEKEKRQLEVLFQNLENAASDLIALAQSLVKSQGSPEFLASNKYPHWRSFLKWSIKAAKQRSPLAVMMGNELACTLRALGLHCEEVCKKYDQTSAKYHYLAGKHSDYLLSDLNI